VARRSMQGTLSFQCYWFPLHLILCSPLFRELLLSECTDALGEQQLVLTSMAVQTHGSTFSLLASPVAHCASTSEVPNSASNFCQFCSKALPLPKPSAGRHSGRSCNTMMCPLCSIEVAYEYSLPPAPGTEQTPHAARPDASHALEAPSNLPPQAAEEAPNMEPLMLVQSPAWSRQMALHLSFQLAPGAARPPHAAMPDAPQPLKAPPLPTAQAAEVRSSLSVGVCLGTAWC
jgi:hypothetical protein